MMLATAEDQPHLRSDSQGKTGRLKAFFGLTPLAWFPRIASAPIELPMMGRSDCA